MTEYKNTDIYFRSKKRVIFRTHTPLVCKEVVELTGLSRQGNTSLLSRFYIVAG